MSYYFFILYFVVNVGCRSIETNHLQSFELVDENEALLGVVKCDLPTEFDTIYRWLNTDDCMCCESVMYRSHSSKFEVIQESGMADLPYLDSGFYFTIVHQPHISCDTQNASAYSDVSIRAEHRKRSIEDYLKNLRRRSEKFAEELVVDTSRIINDITYDIFYFSDVNTHKALEDDSIIIDKVSFNKLVASTEYNDRSIGFIIQSNIHQRDSFYHLAMHIMKSVIIE